jgi:hypothetical protein
VEHADFAALSPDEVAALGSFDRALMYATLHYARSDDEGERMLANAVSALRPGGRALIGNVPLQELADEAQPVLAPPAGAGARVRAALGWVARGPVLRRAATLAFLTLKGRLLDRRAAPGDDVPSLPPGYLTTLTRERVERWLERAPAPIRHEWRPPAVGSPLSVDRADLLIERVG